MGVSPTSGVLTPLAEARERLSALCASPAPLTLPLFEAIGRVAAVDLVVPAPCPIADLALTDGWAVASADTVGASPYAPACLAAPHPIAFAEPLPPGCDAVLPEVGGSDRGGLLVAEATLAPGENTRRRGGDLAAGTVLVEAGRPLAAATAALARLVGLTTADVHAPRVALSGDGDALGDLAAVVLSGLGCRIDRIDRGAPFVADTTLVLVIDDADTPLDRELGVTGLALTGAERVSLGRLGGLPAITLPARFEILVAVLETLVVPTLARLGVVRPDDVFETRPLARKLASRVGFSEIALLDVDDAGRWVPLAVGDLPWSAWAGARGLVELPPESEGSPEDTPLTARRPLVRIRSDRRPLP